MTQQNTALVEEVAAAAESLMEQADELMNAVSVFKLEGESSHKERRAANSPMRTSVTTTRPAPVKVEKVSAKTGTDDGEWEEF